MLAHPPNLNSPRFQHLSLEEIERREDASFASAMAEVAREIDPPEALMTSEEFLRLSHQSAIGFMSSDLERQARETMDALRPELRRGYAAVLSEMWQLPLECFAPRTPPPAPKPQPRAPRTRRFRQRGNQAARYWDEPAP